MKFIASADFHIPAKAPRNRKDKYFDTVMGKVEWILSFAQEHNAVLAVAGDIFDTSKVSNDVIRQVIALMRMYGVEIYVVPGQHDLIYHTKGMGNTPLAILEAAECVTILDGSHGCMSNESHEIIFWGAGWESENEFDMDTGPCNIVLAHTLVTKEGPLFPGQTNFISAEGICNKYPDADWIISGDNHLPHVHESNLSNININCGSIVRKNKDQIDYKPAVWLCDTEDGSYEQIFIPIVPGIDVFDLSKIELDEKKAESKIHLDALVEKIKTKTGKPDFKVILRNVVKEAKPIKAVKDIVNDIMEIAGGKIQNGSSSSNS